MAVWYFPTGFVTVLGYFCSIIYILSFLQNSFCGVIGIRYFFHSNKHLEEIFKYVKFMRDFSFM